jgi:hypothetical protein
MAPRDPTVPYVEMAVAYARTEEHAVGKGGSAALILRYPVV